MQSVALRLICEREAEIEAFEPEEYWSIIARLRAGNTDPFLSKLFKVKGGYQAAASMAINVAEFGVTAGATGVWSYSAKV